MGDPVRVGVVGSGPWAAEHLTHLGVHPAVEVSGVWARRPEAATALALRLPDNMVTLRLVRLAALLAESAGGTDLRSCYAAMDDAEYEEVLQPLADAKAAAY